MRFPVIDVPGGVKLPARLVCSIIPLLLELFVKGWPVLTAAPNSNGLSAALIHRLEWLFEEAARTAFRTVLVRIIGRKEYPVDANYFDRTLQVRLVEHSARCDVQILPHVIYDGPSE